MYVHETKDTNLTFTSNYLHSANSTIKIFKKGKKCFI